LPDKTRLGGQYEIGLDGLDKAGLMGQYETRLDGPNKIGLIIYIGHSYE